MTDYEIRSDKDSRTQKQVADSRPGMEDRYRLLFENMTSGFALLEMLHIKQESSADGRFLDVNKAFELMSGRSVESILGRTIMEILPEEGRRWLEACDQVAQTGVPTLFESHVTSPDKWFEVRVFRTAQNQFGIAVSDITERKGAEALLHQEYESYADLVNSQPAGMYLLRVYPRERWQKDAWNNPESAPYFLEFVSDHFCEMLGIDRHVFAVNPGIVMDMVHPDDKAECTRRNKEANARLIPFRWEGRLIARGRTLWVHLESLPRPVANGDVLWMGILYDISDLKQAEEALRDSEERYRSMIDNLPGFVYRCNNDHDWTMSFISDGCREITGYAPEDFLQNRKLAFNDIVRPDYRERVWQHVQDCLRRKEAFQHEYPIVVASGETDHWVWERGRGIFSDVGELLYVEGFITDITERKRAENEILREQAFFDRLVETAPEGIAITGALGRVLRVNAEFVHMFGYSVDEAVGQIIDDLVAPPSREEEARSITSSTSGGGEARLETVRRRKDGSLIDVSLIAAPIRIGGEQEAVYSIYRDISERKRAEEARERAESQLRQSQKLEAIGKLAGGVAHDFNNLLTGILGNIALVRSSLTPTDPLKENLDAAETAARQAANLTKGLLTFGRSAMVLPIPMSITTALDATLALLRQSLPSTVEIIRDDEEEAWNVLADQSQITQILLNLSVNARDAMKGRGTLTVRTRNEIVEEEYVQTRPFARTGEFVHLSVTDTGSGIPLAIMEHLFEPFHTTKPVGSGTGLGLSIVYGAVKQAGGWITAASVEDAGRNAPAIGQASPGTTFDIYLPRCLQEPVRSSAPASMPQNAGSSTVLVVEDEPVVCAVAQALLTRSGYHVRTAANGVQALEMIASHPGAIDVVMLDMTMPGMTTDEIVQAIRVLDSTVPILLNSGYTSSDVVNQMLADGTVQDFLSKPYELQDLVEKIHNLLRRE